MGFFDKVFVKETGTNKLVDITTLDRKHYESFLDAMEKLKLAYEVAIKEKENGN